MTPAAPFSRTAIGLLRPGDRADLLVLEDDLAVRSVVRDGAPLDS